MREESVLIVCKGKKLPDTAEKLISMARKKLPKSIRSSAKPASVSAGGEWDIPPISSDIRSMQVPDFLWDGTLTVVFEVEGEEDAA